MRKKIFSFGFVALFLLFSGLLLNGCLPHKHSWSDWQQKSPATCTQAEIVYRVCKDCQTTEKKDGVAPLGHTFVDTIIEPTISSNGYTSHLCPCGEEYRENETCLVTFENKANNLLIDENELPQIDDIIINKGDSLKPIEPTEEFKVVEYRNYLNSNNYSVIDTTIQNSIKITLLWDYIIPQELTEEEKEFYRLINNIEKLETLSNLYNEESSSTNDPQIRVLQYLRQARYGDSQWNILGGTIESDFEKFVAYNNSNLKSLQNIEYIYNPFSKEKIDFIHLIAIINVISKGGINNTLSNDMAGWGGDLCQLALELKNTGLTGTELQEKANQLFGAEVSTFSSQDLLADLDAVNIANIYLNNQNKSISQSIKEYYRSVNTDKRKADVIKATFSEFKNQDTLKSTEEITSLIITRLSKNSLISIWCSRNGISIKNNAEIFNSCAIAFAKYFTKTNRLVSFL